MPLMMKRNPSMTESQPISQAISIMGAAAGNMGVAGLQVLSSMKKISDKVASGVMPAGLNFGA